MSYLADLHVHSHLSRATSRECSLEGFCAWAQRKGIRVVATGDFTHPAWAAELKDKLTDAGNGLLKLRPELKTEVDSRVPTACRQDIDFILNVEISCIYKRDGAVRKVHAWSSHLTSTLLTPSTPHSPKSAISRPTGGLFSGLTAGTCLISS